MDIASNISCIKGRRDTREKINYNEIYYYYFYYHSLMGSMRIENWAEFNGYYIFSKKVKKVIKLC